MSEETLKQPETPAQSQPVVQTAFERVVTVTGGGDFVIPMMASVVCDLLDGVMPPGSRKHLADKLVEYATEREIGNRTDGSLPVL